MFRRIENSATQSVTVEIDGQTHQVPAGISVAAAILLCGLKNNRCTPVSGEPRLPYCMMGLCFDCLMQIDGVPNQQACQILVKDAMKIEAQQGAADLTPK